MNIASLNLPDFNTSGVQDLVRKCTAIHHNLLSLLTIVALVMTLASKRFARSIETQSSPPKNLVNNLSQAMKVAKELQLDIPGSLQARAVKYIGP